MENSVYIITTDRPCFIKGMTEREYRRDSRERACELVQVLAERGVERIIDVTRDGKSIDVAELFVSPLHLIHSSTLLGSPGGGGLPAD